MVFGAALRSAPAWKFVIGPSSLGILPASCSRARQGLAYRGLSDSRPKRAVFPGQFDPLTNGHLDVIRRGAPLFDELIVGVGVNPEKSELFSQEERLEIVQHVVGEMPGVRVERYNGLTADFVRAVGATCLLRGIRDITDLRYEFQSALANRAVGGVETLFLMTGDQYALTSSSLIRQVVTLGGNVETLRMLVPAVVVERLQAKQAIRE